MGAAKTINRILFVDVVQPKRPILNPVISDHVQKFSHGRHVLSPSAERARSANHVREFTVHHYTHSNIMNMVMITLTHTLKHQQILKKCYFKMLELEQNRHDGIKYVVFER